MTRRLLPTGFGVPGLARCAILTVSIITMLSAGCGGGTGADPPFAPAWGPHIKPLNIGCVYPPIPKKAAFLYTPVQVTPMWNGDWLVADGGNFNGQYSKVVMFSPKGKPLLVIGSGSLRFVHSAYLTTRGYILISDTGNNRVIEVDPKRCKVVFNTDDLGPGHGFLGRGRLQDGSQLWYPNDAKEIPNGHYLISSRLTNTVFEIDRHGHVFWKCSSFYNPFTHRADQLHGQHNPWRLPNGDTLISDSDNGRVVIVNPGCTRLVWQYTGRPLIAKNGTKTWPFGRRPLIWPRDAMKMANGDILIDDSIHNRCLEVNMKHEVVRQYFDLPQPYSCWPMPNGVVASGDQNTHGIVLWGPGTPQAQMVAMIPKHPLPPPFKAPSHLVNGDFETEASSCVVENCASLAPGCGNLGTPPSGGVLGWQEDDLLTESLPPGAKSPLSFTKSVARCGYSSGEISWERRDPVAPNKPILEHAPILFSQIVHVFPYRKYTLSGWIKLVHVRLCAGCDFGLGSTPGKYAYFAIVPLRSSPWANPTFPSFPKLTGTTTSKDGTGWVHQSQTFYIPQGVHYINIQCILTGAGTVYFDGLSLRDTPWRQKPGT